MTDVKRIMDLVLAGWLLVFLSPLLLGIAFLLRLGSPGPVLFRQRRIGRGLRPFTLLKFRSMVVDAPSLGGWSTGRNDPRITPIGRLLRRTSLDELPQILNVIAGDMSLVGPRPDVPEQMSNYTDEERALRHRVRPGITGWAQVRGRNELDARSRTSLDLDYVRRHDPVLDFRILLLTVAQVLGRGSY